MVADSVPAALAFQPVRLWPPKGRIGRLRLLVYATSMILAIQIAAVIAVAMGRSMGAANTNPTIVGFLTWIAFLAGIFPLYIQRAHDMDWSGWASLVCMIPLVNLVFVFKAGTPGANRYGAPPPPNGVWVKIGAFVMFGIFFLGGILAAIAIPQYQQYVQRARAASQH